MGHTSPATPPPEALSIPLADHYLSLTASASYLDVHRDTLRRAVDRGELPAIKLGPRGDLRIRRRDLDAYGSAA